MATDILVLASPLAASAKKASAGVSRREKLSLLPPPPRTTDSVTHPLVVVVRVAKVRGRMLISGEACLLISDEVWRLEALRTIAESV